MIERMTVALSILIEFLTGILAPTSAQLRRRATWRLAIAARVTARGQGATGRRKRRLLRRAAFNFERAAWLQACAAALEGSPRGVLVSDGSDEGVPEPRT